MEIPAGLREIQTRISDIMQRFDPPPKRPGQARAQTGPDLQKNPRAVWQREIPGQNTAGPTNTSELQRRAELQSSGGPKFSAELEKIIERQAEKHKVSPDLIRAVIRAESGGKADAVSKAGAQGLMQLMPGTAKGLGVNPLNPSQNVDGGTRYLKAMASQFGNLDDTLAAYNAGPGAVKKYGGTPPFAETQAYVKKIRGFLAAQRRQAPGSEQGGGVDFRR